MSRAEIVIHMPHSEEQSHRQHCTYNISCHIDSSNQKPRSLPIWYTTRETTQAITNI